jgi:hypothetical protein
MFSSKEIEKRGPGRDVGKIYHPVMNGSKNPGMRRLDFLSGSCSQMGLAPGDAAGR